MKRRVLLVLVVCASAAGAACNDLLGNSEHPLAADAATGMAGDSSSGSGSGSGSSGGGDSGSDGTLASDGSSTDARLDAGTCDADLATSSQNCGRCGHACIGTACSAGLCGVTSSNPMVAADYMATSQSVLYVCGGGFTGDGGTVSSYAPSTEQVLPIAASLNNPGPIAVRPPYVFWATGDAFVMRAGLDGSSPTILWSGMTQPACIAVNSTSVFWTDDSGNIVYEALDGGADGSQTFPGGGGTSCVAANDAFVAYAQGQATLWVYPLDGGAGTSVAAPSDGLSGLGAPVAVAGSNVYFTTHSGGQDFNLYQIVAGDPTPTPRLLTAIMAQLAPSSLVADPAGVYWPIFDPNDGGIGGCADPLCASGITLVLGPYEDISGMALDPVFVYFSSVSSPNVYRFQR